MNNPFHDHKYLVEHIVALSSRVNALEKELDEVKQDYIKKGKPGATAGSYRHVDEVHPMIAKNPKGNVVSPKTPQKVEWDEQQKLKELNEKFRVGPK